MITSWELYWLTRFDSLRDVFMVLIVLSVLGLGSAMAQRIGFPDGSPGWYPEKGKWFWKSGIFLFLSVLLYALVPSTKEMAAIIVIPKLTQAISGNDEIQKLPSNLLGLANEWIEELKPKKEQ